MSTPSQDVNAALKQASRLLTQVRRQLRLTQRYQAASEPREPKLVRSDYPMHEGDWTPAKHIDAWLEQQTKGERT